MSAKSQLLATIDETPRSIAAGTAIELQTLFVYNSNATGAWVKVYASVAAPVSTDTPIWQAFVGQGAVVLPAFFGGAQLWIVGSANPGASFTAPPADLVGSLTYAKQ